MPVFTYTDEEGAEGHIVTEIPEVVEKLRADTELTEVDPEEVKQWTANFQDKTDDDDKDFHDRFNAHRTSGK